ncbi:MAG: MFS transporter [Gammaproteobacteria bacterium]
MSEQTFTSANTDDAARFGPVWLNPGVSRRNALTYFYAALTTIGMVAFLSFMQPYLLEENLGIPSSEQGRATSLLALPYEFAFLLMVGPLGALADRIGRRPIYVVGFLWVGTVMVLLPLTETLLQLAVLRAFYGIGSACITSMMATVLADYPQERSRGKMLAFSGICNGLGAIVMVLLFGRLLLSTFSEMGYDDLMTGRLTYWCGAGLAVITALILSRGLKSGRPGKAVERVPVRKQIYKGAQAARGNPRILIACCEAFIARGDLVVVSTFLSLWAKEAGLLAGLTLPEAIGAAAGLAATVSSAQLLFSPVVGYFIDKLDRLTAMATAMAIAGVAYLWVGFSPDPLAMIFIPAALLLGMGEAAAILSGAAVVGQEAEQEIRGAVIGLFNFCGSVGTLTIVFVGGFIFDAWMPGAPFIMVGVINLLVMTGAIYVRRHTGYTSPDYLASTAD